MHFLDIRLGRRQFRERAQAVLSLLFVTVVLLASKAIRWALGVVLGRTDHMTVQTHVRSFSATKIFPEANIHLAQLVGSLRS